ncbi:hypothetical protein F441_11883 [Phytophthora nicotianae CJ01A1]|uniref:Uncharacterized protein n=4 Tax=Phytophthora nicotianae TaxID=4792 RepID=W2Q287_PHYN3|nr:hypothetical protein PPTG_23335 [Phytophthora nicotianae INRA-310]ETL89683.1 hypothetical protein L917_11421 [Phytophthora nicotianae]ETM42961.1 hypothetical protein L914_11469 [Phytophthora nicotianae]ETN06684.1 hypothetical protein PPTG_23335 [Phytophthora nicotianae INRA-310]ETP12792.1 hypothetical protein F441_11883 [Phytophthora nicotianae CJ01A1]
MVNLQQVKQKMTKEVTLIGEVAETTEIADGIEMTEDGK